jgi:hypothetical protein
MEIMNVPAPETSSQGNSLNREDYLKVLLRCAAIAVFTQMYGFVLKNNFRYI